MLSVHDNTCSGYRFSGVDRQLILETEYPSGSEKEGQRSDIVFDGVWCHHLEAVQEGNIIFEIEEVDLARVEIEFRGVFDRLKNYGWPRLEAKNDTLSEVIERHQLNVYRIGTSYGLEGFVFAKSVSQTNSEQAGRGDGDKPSN
jgi:hypothetical protein